MTLFSLMLELKAYGWPLHRPAATAAFLAVRLCLGGKYIAKLDSPLNIDSLVFAIWMDRLAGSCPRLAQVQMLEDFDLSHAPTPYSNDEFFLHRLLASSVHWTLSQDVKRECLVSICALLTKAQLQGT